MSEEEDTFDAFVISDRRTQYYLTQDEVMDVYAAKIGAYGVAVYNALTRHGSVSFPSLRRLEKMLGLSRHTILKAISKLEEFGLIQVLRTKNPDGSSKPNVYTLIDLPRKEGVVNDVDQGGVVHEMHHLVHDVHHKETSSLNSYEDSTKEGNKKGGEGRGGDEIPWKEEPQDGDSSALQVHRPEVMTESDKLAQLLSESICVNNRLVRTPSWGAVKKWAQDIDKLNRLDGISWANIRAVLEWCQKDSFWSSNILSGKKFREKWDILTAQMNRQGRGKYVGFTDDDQGDF